MEEKDISNKEYAELQRLIALVDALQTRTSRLDERARLAEAGTYRDLCLLRKLARKVCDNIARTIPNKRRRLINEEIKRTACIIEVEPPLGLPAKKHTEYTTVPLNALEWLVLQTVSWHCVGCEKDRQDVKKCPFREQLDSLHCYEVPALRKGECPWATMGELV